MSIPHFTNNEDRCKFITDAGHQCPNQAVLVDKANKVYGPRCYIHGGYHEQKRHKVAQVKSILQTKWQTEIQRHATNSNFMSIREEIGILRIMLERILNQCDNDDELLMESQRISDLVAKIEKAVANCHKMEVSLGNVLDRPTVMNFGAKIVGILATYIEDAEVLHQVSSEILDLSKNLNNDKEDDEAEVQ